jgi:hypothetical protein
MADSGDLLLVQQLQILLLLVVALDVIFIGGGIGK